MDDTSRESVMAWQFLRRHFVRIVIGAVLAVAVYFAISINATYQQEQRIARKINESHEGLIHWEFSGPNWTPQTVRDLLPFLNRIVGIQLLSTESLSELGSLTNLQHLNLTGTGFTDAGLEHLTGLTRLEELYLWDTEVTDSGLAHLKRLVNLKVLHLDTTRITDAGLEHIKGLTKLTELGLSTTKVIGPGFEHLKGLASLKFVVLRYTQLTDAGLEHLKRLTNLEELYLTNTHVTDEGRVKLRKALPNCQVILER